VPGQDPAEPGAIVLTAAESHTMAEMARAGWMTGRRLAGWVCDPMRAMSQEPAPAPAPAKLEVRPLQVKQGGPAESAGAPGGRDHVLPPADGHGRADQDGPARGEGLAQHLRRPL